MSTGEFFKTCPNCAAVWEKREEFLADSSVRLKGYGADFEKLEEGLFYFTHENGKCLTTMVLQAKDFLDLYPGTRYSGRRTGQADCPGYCLRKDQLDRCEALCECAFVREIVHIIKGYPKGQRVDSL